MTTETTPNDTTADAAETAATTALGDAAATTEGDAATQQEGDVTEGKAEGEAEQAQAPSILGAPEAYDVAAFQMPEGFEFDGELFDAVKDDLKALDLSQDGASKIVAMFAEKVAPKIAERAGQAMEAQAQEISANLARDLQADPEVGGKHLKESQAHAAKAIAHFIPDGATRSEFSTFLNESGLGNHPLLVRVIAGAGKLLSEATTVAGGTASQPLTDAQKFYGKG